MYRGDKKKEDSLNNKRKIYNKINQGKQNRNPQEKTTTGKN